MKTGPDEKRERRRLRTQRRLEKMLALLERPAASRVVPDVDRLKARFASQLAIVRDPAAYKTWNRRVVTHSGTRRRWR